MMVLAIMALVLGLFVLAFSANHLVNTSVRIAQYFKVSALFIGLTVIAFGTSAPELFLSAIAAINGNGALSVGNVIGSNIFNLGFILGLSAIVAPILINKKLVYRDGFFMLAITGLVFAMLWDQHVAWREGAILLSLLVGYISFLLIKKDTPQEEDMSLETPKLRNFLYLFLAVVVLSLLNVGNANAEFTVSLGLSIYTASFIGILLVLLAIAYFRKDLLEINKKGKGIILNVAKLLASLGLLVLSSDLIVVAAVFIAQFFGVSEWAIGATIVAAGTSLPEVAATVMAIAKKRYDMGIGNVIGSDIFNILGVIGISSLIAPLELTSKCLFVAECAGGWSLLLRDNTFSLSVLFLTLGITFIFMRTNWRLSKTEGIFLFSFALLRIVFEINPNFFFVLFGG